MNMDDAFFHIINHTTHHLGQITVGLTKKFKLNSYPEFDYPYYPGIA